MDRSLKSAREKISLGKRHMNKYNYRIIVGAQLILLFDRLKFAF